MGVQGARGPDGTPGSIWTTQPTIAELVDELATAAKGLSPRTLIDPRAGFQYVSAVASRLIRLEGGLLLRAVIVEADPDDADDDAPPSRIHAIA